jgi:chaperonin GroES
MKQEEICMSSAIQPLADYVVAQSEEPETKTASGLYLPGGAQEKPKTAKVVAVGKEVKHVKVGDRIIYKTYSTTEVKVGKEEYILVKEEDVLATVK